MYFLNKRKNNKYKRKFSDDPFDLGFARQNQLKAKVKTKNDWSEDVFVEQGEGKETLNNTFNFSKIYFIYFVILLLFIVLLLKSAWLQIKNNDYYYKMAERNRVRIKRIEPKRGIIYDKDMVPMVRNRGDFILYLIPADLPGEKKQKQEIINKIGNILGAEVKNKINSELAKIDFSSLDSYSPLYVASNIEYEKAMKLYLQSKMWPGVVLSTKARREYLNLLKGGGENNDFLITSLSHIIGYTGKINEKELKKFGKEYLPIDYIGKMGIEYFWENELRGRSGKKEVEVDALGKEKKILQTIDAEDGHNLVLSIDIKMQAKLEEILKAHLEKLKLKKASAIILNPQNGEVLAMVSLPSYDNNLFAKGIGAKDYQILSTRPDKPLFNRAISGEYPSGSTFKLVMASAALQEKIVSENTYFISTGGLRIGKWFFPDWLAGGHGRTNLKKAISQSVNTYFYYIGGGYNDFQGLGVDRIVKYAKLFGLGSQTGIDLAGEADGFLPSREWKEKTKGERWYIGDTYHLSIGQGDLLVTPLQVAVFTSVFANGGSLYRPHFVSKVLNSKDELIKTINTDPVRKNFIDPYNINVVREGMRMTVSSGSGRRLSVLKIKSAGKTGTAQWSSKKEPHAWYTGFAPYKNPKIAFTVLIEEGGEGSSVCVPVMYDFLEWYEKEYIEKDINKK